MQHRYLVWTGRYHGRRYTEMHIINSDDKPICATWRSASVEDDTIYRGRPKGHALCRYCTRALPAFEQAEKLRTWQALGQKEPPP